MGEVKVIYLPEWYKLKPSEIKSKYGVERLDNKDLEVTAELERKGQLSIRQYTNGIEIESYSYVGVVKLKNFKIIIIPKIKQIELARMVSFAYGLDNIDILGEIANLEVEYGFISEILALIFVNEAENIIYKGVSKKYREREEDISSCRGRIVFNRLASNVSLGLTLPCRYQELTKDIAENRVVLGALKEITKWIETPLLKRRVNILVARLSSEVTYEPLSRVLLDRAKQEVNRLTSHYVNLLELAEIILESRDFSLTAGSTSFTSFLLDMNLLFERFIYNYFQYVADSNVTIRYQKSMSNNYINSGGNHHSLRPDYMFFKGRKLAAIADAKYKDYLNKRVSPSDLYQLTVYSIASKEQVEKVYLFYPADENFDSMEEYVLYSVFGKPIRIIVKGFPLKSVLNNLPRNYPLPNRHQKIWSWFDMLLD